MVITCGLAGLQLPYAGDLVFNSTEELDRAERDFVDTADASLECFITAAKQKDYQSAYQAWSNLFFRYLSLQLMLSHTQNLSGDRTVKLAAPEIQERLGQVFQKKLQDERLKKTFLTNAQNAAALAPQHRFFTSRILKQYPQTPEVLAAEKMVESLPQASFAQMLGDAKPICGQDLSEWKVFTANIICFPGTLTYIHGGITPWKERIEPLCNTILETGADVVCLQEVWDPEAMQALISRLKKDYAYFIYNGGDASGTLDPSEAGYNSGLFLASKIALDEVTFHKFPRSIPETSNRGVIIATFSIANKKMALATTHLQHGSASNKEMKAVRFEQLTACKDLLENAEADGAVFLGDINIDAFSPEFQESRLFQEPR